MNTGRVVCGLPLYELPEPCAAVVRRLNNLETNAIVVGYASEARIPVDELGLSVAEWMVLARDDLVRFREIDGVRLAVLTELARRVVTYPAELDDASGVPSVEARAEFERRFEEASAALAPQVERGLALIGAAASVGGRRERRRRERQQRRNGTRTARR
jgi:hypothetical protein